MEENGIVGGNTHLHLFPELYLYINVKFINEFLKIIIPVASRSIYLPNR